MRKPLLALLVPLAAACSEGVADEHVAAQSSATTASITEVTGFGTNPAGLQMFEHVPASLGANPALVVVLHGCTEGAAGQAADGWNDVADKNGFVVVYPQQSSSNNPLSCFNWAGKYGDPTNIQRGKLENESIKEMVDKAKAAHGIDPKKVYIAGFSAGGAYVAVMTSVWPEVFAAGAIMAGVPYDCTTTYSEVSSCQNPGKTHTPAEWGDLVRKADASFAGPWPRMSIWQGDADTTVGTANRGELVKQWTNVLGAPATPTKTDTVDGQKHEVYADASGHVLVESYLVAGMKHAVPVAPSKGCGTAGSYAEDHGICAAQHVWEFFSGVAPASVGDGGASSSSSSSGGGSSSSSSSSSSSTSSGGASPEGGAAPDTGGGGSYGSTCAFAPASRDAHGLFAMLGALAVLAFRKKQQKGARR